MGSSSIPPLKIKCLSKTPPWAWRVIVIAGFSIAGIMSLAWLFAYNNRFSEPTTMTLVTTNNCGGTTLQLDWFVHRTFEITTTSLDLYYLENGQKISFYGVHDSDFFVGWGNLYSAPLPQHTNIPTKVFETPQYNRDEGYEITTDRVVNIFVDPYDVSPQQFNNIVTCFSKNLDSLNKALNKIYKYYQGRLGEDVITLKFGGLAYTRSDDLLSKIEEINTAGSFHPLTIQKNGVITREEYPNADLYFGDIFTGPLDFESSTNYYKTIKNAAGTDFFTYLAKLRNAFK